MRTRARVRAGPFLNKTSLTLSRARPFLPALQAGRCFPRLHGPAGPRAPGGQLGSGAAARPALRAWTQPGTPAFPGPLRPWGWTKCWFKGGSCRSPPPLSSVPKRPFAPALAFHPPPGPGAGSHPGTRGVEDVCCCRGLRRAHPQDQPGPTRGHLARPLDVEVPGRDARGHGGCRRSRGAAPAPSGEGLPSWGRRRRLGLLFEAAGKAGVQLPGASSRAGSGANPQRAEGKTALSPGPPSQGLTEGKFAVTSDA